MCGIFGVFGRPNSFDPSIVEKGTAALHHRGPDGQRHWFSKDGRVGLGHARLSIIDLEGGTQPLSNDDGSIHAVVNGEIYDFERIRKELGQRGHRLATHSDSEVLIHLYEDFGLDAIHQLRGEFAFVLWDSNARRLVAGRDRFGIKPLFYSKQNHALYLASEVKALFAAGVRATWDQESFYQSLATGTAGPLQGRSLFDGVLQVPPGHMLVTQGEQITLHPYWDFDYPVHPQSDQKSEQEYIEEFRNLFEESVRLRLRADVPVGVYLSGGLDSCAVLGTAAKFKGAGLKAFNLSFDTAEYDERPIAEEMAARAGADFHPIAVTEDMLVSNFIAATRQCETLMFNSHGVAKYILSKAVHDSGFKVVLTGEGSDEILAGYPHFRRDLLLQTKEHGQGENIGQAMTTLINKNQVSRGLLLNEETFQGDNALLRRLGFVPSWLEMFLTMPDRFKAFFSKEFKDAYSDYDPMTWLLNQFDVRRQLNHRHPVNQSLYLWSKSALPHYILTVLGDRMEMGHSVEGRVPLLDHHLVEFVTTLPSSMKINNMVEKYILREAARPVLTQTVYERQKHPFVTPPSRKQDSMANHLNEVILDQIKKMPMLDSKAVETFLGSRKSMTSEELQLTDPILITLASAAVLQEQYRL